MYNVLCIMHNVLCIMVSFETVSPFWTTFSTFLSDLDKLIDIVNFEEQIMVDVKLALEKNVVSKSLRKNEI